MKIKCGKMKVMRSSHFDSVSNSSLFLPDLLTVYPIHVVLLTATSPSEHQLGVRSVLIFK